MHDEGRQRFWRLVGDRSAKTRIFWERLSENRDDLLLRPDCEVWERERGGSGFECYRRCG